MIPASIDVADLAQQADGSGVAFCGEPTLPVDDQARLELDLKIVVGELNGAGAGSLASGDTNAEAPHGRVCVIISNEGGISAPDLRDVAQAVDDATACNLVIARAPGAVSLVSDAYSRAELERVEIEVAQQPDYPASVRYAVDNLHDASPQAGLIVGFGAALCCAVAVAAVMWQRGLVRVWGGVATQQNEAQ